jgi:hypothetical protein
MDKKIVATSIAPEQPEAPRLIIRLSGIGLIVGVVAIVVGSFWPVVGPWMIAAGILILIVAFSLLAPYWNPSLDHRKRDDIRNLYETNKSNQSMKPTAPPRNAFDVFATTPCRGLSLFR